MGLEIAFISLVLIGIVGVTLLLGVIFRGDVDPAVTILLVIGCAIVALVLWFAVLEGNMHKVGNEQTKDNVQSIAELYHKQV